MKTSLLLLVCLNFLYLVNTYSQQIGNGGALQTGNLNSPLLSGGYQINGNQTGFPDNSADQPWKHLFVIRHNATTNNYQLQISSSYATNDRLFFRKIASNSLTNVDVSWNEMATRGTNNFIGDQNINGKVFLHSQNIVDSWNASYLQWAGHRLIMGSPSGVRFHNSLELRPGGADNMLLHSEFSLFTTDKGINNRKVLIHSNAASFFNGGNVGIGTENPTAKLTVAGDIHAREIKVETNAGADFVFDDHYPLRSLSEVEQFITQNKHLPDIAPADSMVQNGVNMGDMQIRLLQKIEELTLYMIELKKENEAQQREIEELKKK